MSGNMRYFQRRPKMFCLVMLGFLILILIVTCRIFQQQSTIIAAEWFHRYNAIQKDPAKFPPKTILWNSPTKYVTSRIFDHHINVFQNCSFKNCLITLDTKEASTSSAIIYDWFRSIDVANFSRSRDQAWIIWQQETPNFYRHKQPLVKYINDGFNWTMGYRPYSDIYLPFGELSSQTNTISKNYTNIALSKTKDALWIVSRCTTNGQREQYVKELQKYITVDILGACGERWTCGARRYHDECFDIMNNTYRYYLAFENSLCDDFYTEKFFENYKYDLLHVVRVGKTASRLTPRDSYIYAGDFASAKDLGMYLKDIGKDVNKYAALLQQKDQYMSIPYQDLFSRAFCELCERLNNIDKYRSIYPDMVLWLTNTTECYLPKKGTNW